MVVSLKANQRRLLVLLGLIALLAAAYFAVCARPAENAGIAGGSNAERLAYINSFGWTVEAEPAAIDEVTIPAQFNDVYTAYNEMQKQDGFDLLPHAGKVCTQYKYRVTNHAAGEDVYLCLLVRDGVIIGADVSSAQLGGFMHGIREFPGTQEEHSESSTVEETVSSEGA
jgi:hypothetical protein